MIALTSYIVALGVLALVLAVAVLLLQAIGFLPGAWILSPYLGDLSLSSGSPTFILALTCIIALCFRVVHHRML